MKVTYFDHSLIIKCHPLELETLIRKISLLKRNCMAAPLEKALNLYDDGLKTPSEVMVIPYRDNETMFVQAFPDRIVVIFSTIFADATDVVLGKVFLQEFGDARKTPGLQNAPQVLFSKEPPLDLKGVSGVSNKEGLHYVIFGTFHFMRYFFSTLTTIFL
jgi:actin related protein 2/3 complex subunit 2